jgi:hypothetical protein
MLRKGNSPPKRPLRLPLGTIPRPHMLPKAATGIRGLDEITEGGLPRGSDKTANPDSGCTMSMPEHARWVAMQR